MSQTLSQFRQHPSVLATEDYVKQHPMVFVGYSVGLIVVYLVVITPLIVYLTRSGFSDNLLYTGPGGALKADLGSCMSHRNSCGAAEPFSPLRAGKTSRSQFSGPSWKTERSRFVNGREPDAVMVLDQEGQDAMVQEIQNIQGEHDDGAAAIMQAHSKVGQAEAAQQASSTSTFASRVGAEAQLESILRQ